MTTATQTLPFGALEGTERKVRILVVDDSMVIRRLITRMLLEEPAFDVVGFARDGVDAIEKAEHLHPDAITLDVEMPELDGLGALRILQQRYPEIKVVMCSSLTERGASVTIDALLAGASDYVTKQHSGELSTDGYELLKADLTAKIKHLFGLDQKAAREVPSRAAPVPRSPVAPAMVFTRRRLTPEVVAIGVSTGGPTALAEMLPMFGSDFPLPIVIVQHMPALFTQLLAERLSRLCHMPVLEAATGMELLPGRMLVAPGNFHMRLARRGTELKVELNQDEPENSCRPAVDVLFRSVSEVFGGAAIAVVLTGMGQDGLLGVRPLKELGAPVLVQNSETSSVWGMPGAVAEAGLADAVLPLQQIVPEILRRL